MKTKKVEIKGGLKELPHDDRDFVYEKVFGSIKPSFPESFFVSSPLKIKDQKSTDFCTAFAVSSTLEDTEHIEINPVYNMKNTRILDGKQSEDWGADLRTACKAAVKYGAIEEMYYPFPDKDLVKDRDFLIHDKNWPGDLDQLAWSHAQNSFFRVDVGSFDAFDNMRMAMLKHKSSIVTGSIWYDSWTKVPKGVIGESKPEGSVGGHAFKLFGFITIEEKEYLVAQLSNGTSIGDDGVFYFPRSIVNEYFTFGSFMFTDMPKDKALVYQGAGVNMGDSSLVRSLKMSLFIIKKLLS